MATLTLSRTVAAAPERVFEVFSDVRQAPLHIKAITRMEVLTDGPVRKGTQFRETRVMFGREHTERMEFVEFDPPRGYTIACDSCGMKYATRFDFKPQGSGTLATMTMNARPVSFFAKLMSPLAKLMMGSMRKVLEADLDAAAKAAEAKPEASVGA